MRFNSRPRACERHQFSIMEKQTNNEGLASATGKEKQEQNETDLELSQKAEPEPESQQNGGEIDEIKYLTGFKLWIVVASVAMAGFLVLLDTMVIGTVIFHFASIWCEEGMFLADR